MAGSETTVHAAMRAMVARGHQVTVIADRTPQSYEHEGVTVKALPRHEQQEAVRTIARDAHILITHLDLTSQAMQLAIDLQKPLIHFVHNNAQLGYWNVDPRVRFKASLVIFNSRAIAESERFQNEPWSGDQIIMHPVVEPELYRCKPGNKITLCNPTTGKGVDTIYRLSEAMPEYEFLVVEGIYGEQIAPPHLGDEWVARHPNIEFMRNSPDFRDVLRKTKVLLMPSNYESYGRCAVEAACAGIPSIVHPTEGLLESLGDAGIFHHRIAEVPANAEIRERVEADNAVRLASWKAEIERLYSDEVYYRKRSDAALKLVESFDPEREFDRLEESLLLTYQKSIEEGGGDVAKKFISDRRLWRTASGGLKAEEGGRIPQDAVTMFAGKGTEIDEEIAIEFGMMPKPEAKAIEAPAENKAIQSPAENKKRGRKKVA